MTSSSYFDRDVVEVIRRHLNALLDELAGSPASEGDVQMTPQPLTHASDGLPVEWRHLESREGETYSWPGLLEEYKRFDVYQGTADEGTTSQWAIGECDRAAVWGRDRKYYIVFRLGLGRGSKQPISEFLETDDYPETAELVAIIRGAGGPRGQRMFEPSADLPAPYAGMTVAVYRDRIAGTPQLRGWNKLAVVAREDDHESMLRHAAIQVMLRH